MRPRWLREKEAAGPVSGASRAFIRSQLSAIGVLNVAGELGESPLDPILGRLTAVGAGFVALSAAKPTDTP